MNIGVIVKRILLVGGMVLAVSLGAEEVPHDEVNRLITRQAQSWETGDEAEFLDTLHDEVVFAYPGKRLDRDGVLKIFRDWKRDFTDTRMTVFRTVIDGAHFAIEYTFATTNRESEARTAAGTVAIGEIRDGKILVWKEYLDGRVSRMQAKGELPVDEEAEPFPWPDTPESRQP